MTEKQKTLISGVSVLAIAGLICKVVGVLYRIPLAAMIQPVGMGIYHKVFPAYNVLLTISSAGVPVAISRQVAHYVELKDARNARRVFQVSRQVLLLLGVVSTVLLMVFSGFIARTQGTEEARLGYLCIAPSLFFVCVMSAYRGYLQGRKRMTPTAVSQLIEQVGKVAIALPLAWLGFRRGGAAWGAAGALLGSTIGEAAALLYMIIFRQKNNRRIEHMIGGKDCPEIPYRSLVKQLLFIAVPITLGACIVPLSGFIDSMMLTNLMEAGGMEKEQALVLFGSYTGPVLTMINVPTAIAMAMSTNLVPDISAGVTRGDMAHVAKETGIGLRMASVIGLPCSIGMSLLAEPVLFLCYSGSYTAAQLQAAASLLRISSLTIVLFTMVQASSGILQGLGKQKIPMYTLLAGVAVKVLFNYTMVRNPDINIHGAPFASLLCYTVSLVPNLIYVHRSTGYRFQWKKIVFKPLLCSLVMGGVVWAVWNFLFGSAVGLSFVKLAAGVLLCVGLGVAVYAVLVVVTGTVDREILPAKLRRFVKK